MGDRDGCQERSNSRAGRGMEGCWMSGVSEEGGWVGGMQGRWRER